MSVPRGRQLRPKDLIGPTDSYPAGRSCINIAGLTGGAPRPCKVCKVMIERPNSRNQVYCDGCAVRRKRIGGRLETR